VKAVYLVRFGSPEDAFEIREIPIPSINENQVLIRVEAFGLNFADVIARKGKYRDCPPLPCVIGYDVVGIIENAGSQVTGLQKGDRVTTLTRFGGYSEFIVADHRGVAKVPEEMPLTFAGAMATQYCTAYYAACECVNVFPGDKALVHAAAGGVGTALVQLLKYKGAVVFGTCSSAEKVKYLQSIGVDYPINYKEVDYKEAILKTVGKERLDLVFDSLGGKYIRDGIKLLGAGGKIIGYGAAELSSARNIFSKIKVALQFGIYHPGSFLIKSKSFIGVYMLALADYKPGVVARCLKNVIRLGEENIIQPAGGLEFSVNELAQAHRALESRKSMGKIMVKW
jgi:NADPH:quinone reductase-like Zn-dependent oxidoreductase